jgi:hypothetical protein
MFDETSCFSNFVAAGIVCTGTVLLLCDVRSLAFVIGIDVGSLCAEETDGCKLGFFCSTFVGKAF